MSKVRWVQTALAAGLTLALCVAAGAQQTQATGTGATPAGAPATLNDALLNLASRAAVVFAGQVTGIVRNDAAGFVEVRFRVEEPVRGCSKLGTYVLREWSGRWAGHAPRYRVGERRLMLLAAPSAAGLSAPVDGGNGAIPLTRTLAGPIAGSQGITPDTGGDLLLPLNVDLRRLQATVLRSVPSTGTERYGATTTSGVEWTGPVMPIEVVPEDAQPRLTDVLSLLRGDRSITLGVMHAAQ